MRPGILCMLLWAAVAHAQADPADAICPRPAPGSAVQAPPELRSTNGVLELTLHLRTAFDAQRLQRFCYRATMPGGAEVEAPTLRVHQGDTLLIHFANEVSTDIHPQTAFPFAAHPSSEPQAMPMHAHAAMPAAPGVAGLPSPTNPADAPCFATSMSARGSNLHFHGVNAAPVCHQDEVVHTLVRAGETFDYRVHIPANEPPGLYWYHPHPHGYTESQVLGGASGALIVERAAGTANTLPERTIILRDQLVTEGTAKRNEANKSLPTWDVSLNFVPVRFPANTPAQLRVPAARREVWRVLNAAADSIFDLEYAIAGHAQTIELQALDGVALATPLQLTHVRLAPGARAEINLRTPAAGQHATLRTLAVDTGPDGETEPARTIADIVLEKTPLTQSPLPAARNPSPAPAGTRSASLDETAAVYQRRLYFSEHTAHPGVKEALTEFYLTLEGQKEKAYVMGQDANIQLHRGAVEEWTIENHARELHVFHIHQVHFTVVARNRIAATESALLDTVEVPYWTGTGPYPSVRVRLDFRARNIVGSFVYHCHILGHEDAGMMGAIDVLPEGFATTTRLTRTANTWTARVSTATAGLAPTGTVQFQSGGVVLAEAALRDGVAIAPAPISSQDIVAIYSGDRFFQASQNTRAHKQD